MTNSLIYIGLLFGSIGSGYALYGKRQQEPVPLICGLLLIGLPYVIMNLVVLGMAGIILVALPFLL